MRKMRFNQLLPRNRETGASAAVRCQRSYSSHATELTNNIAAAGATTHEYAPAVAGQVLPHPPQSSSNTTFAAFPKSKSTPGALMTPSPLPTQQPILLLEGDNYKFSASGIARSLYQLVSEPSNSRDVIFASSNLGSTTTTHSLAIEEIYDLPRGRKAFAIREKKEERRMTGKDARENQERIIRFDDSSQQTSLLLQEIADGGGANGVGTGGRTWDSSIAMSAYFASHPGLLYGNVIELGSGVGLGGILSFLFRSLSSSTVPFHSMTLSDSKPQVIDCCNDNIQSFLKSYPSFSSISVQPLDWYDVLNRTGDSSSHAESYDTVIACDCAYDYTDIAALVGTLKGLLKKKKTSKAHVFGPSNRGGLHRLISQLRQEKVFVVKVEYIQMVRYRLEPPLVDDSLGSLLTPTDKNNLRCHSKFDSEFLHVTCSLRLDSEEPFREQSLLPDID